MPVMPTPQVQSNGEATLDESQLEERSSVDSTNSIPAKSRLEALKVKKARLDATLAELQQRRSELVDRTKLPSGLDMPTDWSEQRKCDEAVTHANGVIKDYIALLNKYNEIKDIAQGLMGLIADQRGERIGEVMQRFDMSEKD